MPVAAAYRRLHDFLCDVQPGNRRSRRDMFESEVRGIVRTDRELRAGFRNDLRFAQHEFGDPLIVAAIECGHPFAKGDTAERHLRMHVLAHEFLRVRGNFAKAQCRTLGAACHDADMLGTHYLTGHVAPPNSTCCRPGRSVVGNDCCPSPAACTQS